MYCLVPGVNLEISRAGVGRVSVAWRRRAAGYSLLFMWASSGQLAKDATEIKHGVIMVHRLGEE